MAAGSTYEPIATTTLSSAQANVTFSTISGNYTDLVLICNAKGASAQSMRMQLNSDTGSNYSTVNTFTDLFGSPSTSSSRYTSENSIRVGYVQNGISTTDFLNCIIQLQNYSNSTTYKSVIAKSFKAVNHSMGLWRSTAAITSIVLFPAGSVNFSSGSSFTLYGIAAA
jgi:hypothetical protein